MNDKAVNFEIIQKGRFYDIVTDHKDLKSYNRLSVPVVHVYAVMSTLTTEINNKENYAVTFTIG